MWSDARTEKKLEWAECSEGWVCQMNASGGLAAPDPVGQDEDFGFYPKCKGKLQSSFEHGEDIFSSNQCHKEKTTHRAIQSKKQCKDL